MPEITSTIDWKIMIHEFQPHPGGYVLVVPSTFSPSYKKLVESFYKVVTSDITGGLCDIIPPVIYLFVSGLAIYLVCFSLFQWAHDGKSRQVADPIQSACDFIPHSRPSDKSFVYLREK